MAETIIFIVGVGAVLYATKWLWDNDDGVGAGKAKKFSVHGDDAGDDN